MASLEWHERPVLNDPVALLAFAGWGDAGESASQAAVEFIEKMDGTLIAVIDPDDHFDFQVRRPVVSLDSSALDTSPVPPPPHPALRAAIRLGR